MTKIRFTDKEMANKYATTLTEAGLRQVEYPVEVNGKSFCIVNNEVYFFYYV